MLENVRIALQRQRGGSFDAWRSDDVLRQFDARARALIDSVGLGDLLAHPAGSLAYARKRALKIAATLALDPVLICSTSQWLLSSIGSWVKVIEGVVFVVCVLGFREGIAGALRLRDG